MAQSEGCHRGLRLRARDGLLREVYRAGRGSIRFYDVYDRGCQSRCESSAERCEQCHRGDETRGRHRGAKCKALKQQMNQPKVTLHKGKFFALVKEGHWEYVDRTNATGAAIIVAVTDEQKLLLVEQYRIPVHARTIELPAGIIGDEPGSGDENHADA